MANSRIDETHQQLFLHQSKNWLRVADHDPIKISWHPGPTSWPESRWPHTRMAATGFGLWLNQCCVQSICYISDSRLAAISQHKDMADSRVAFWQSLCVVPLANPVCVNLNNSGGRNRIRHDWISNKTADLPGGFPFVIVWTVCVHLNNSGGRNRIRHDRINNKTPDLPGGFPFGIVWTTLAKVFQGKIYKRSRGRVCIYAHVCAYIDIC